jgi:AAHS family 4-hydroxybenzoate transporter-like MFS transporter
LFTEGRMVRTLLLWVPFFTSFGVLGITVVWTPVLLRDHGIPPSQAAFVLGVHNIGALIGMSSAGRLIERYGARATLVPGLLLGAGFVGALGYAAASVPAMAAALFLVGLFVGLGASGSIALAALSYPTAMRSTGIGWAMGMGRFGQVLAPLLAAAAAVAGWTGSQLFLLFAIAPVLGALAILVLRSGRPLAAAARRPEERAL